MGRTLIATALALLIAAQAAHAGTAEVGSPVCSPKNSCTDRSSVSYVAAPGERNVVTYSGGGGTWTLRDSGAPVTAGRGCTSRGPHAAVCEADTGHLSVYAGDGNDAVDVPRGSIGGGEGDDRIHASGFLGGGPGDDEVIGREGADAVGGGGGTDVVRGGGGRDELRDGDWGDAPLDADVLDGGAGRDRLEYFDVDGLDVRLDLGAERLQGDVLSDVEEVSVRGESARMVGDAEPNYLITDAGRNVMRGRGGDDELTALSSERDVLAGGPGDDWLTLPAPTRIDNELDSIACGPGFDTVDAVPRYQLVPRDCERAFAGRATFLLGSAVPHPRVAVALVRGLHCERRCEITLTIESAGEGGKILGRRVESFERLRRRHRIRVNLSEQGRRVLRRRGDLRVWLRADGDDTQGDSILTQLRAKP
ncbi:MAG: hypothetical protein QOI98_1614 [Solirubrobacteraceae bacterium]|jgi:hypothetical protein|nr:hypothetical protein [Solirubrobacteraceae bacterium]